MQCVSLWASAAVAQGVHPIEYRSMGPFESPALSESSGVAVSRAYPGLLWTHNDSGDQPRIYAAGLAGEDLGTYTVKGAAAIDWEDIALGPCPDSREGPHCLYVADTGDNMEHRENVVVYVFAEPRPQARGASGVTEVARPIRIRYPDGAHDVEALAVSAEGDLLLISKGRTPPVIAYSVSHLDINQQLITATVIDTLPIPAEAGLMNQVTAAAISPFGGLLAVRTYSQIFFFRRIGTSWQQTGAVCNIGLRQPQGESVDFLDSTSVVLASEAALGRPGGLAQAKCPLEVSHPGPTGRTR